MLLNSREIISRVCPYNMDYSRNLTGERGLIRGKIVNLQGKELEEFHNGLLKKIKLLKTFLENMESTYGEMDLTRCSDQAHKLLRCSDEMINIAMKGIQAKLKEMEEIQKG